MPISCHGVGSPRLDVAAGAIHATPQIGELYRPYLLRTTPYSLRHLATRVLTELNPIQASRRYGPKRSGARQCPTLPTVVALI